jgi:hypothetical protein
MVEQDYEPVGMDYAPYTDEEHRIPLPRKPVGAEDGIEILGTYRSHDFTPADRFFTQQRSAAMWEVMSFGPNFRNLLSRKQVEKYNIQSRTISARPLPQNNYFLGYVQNPEIAADIGASTLGSMGSY